MGITRTKKYNQEYIDFLSKQDPNICGLCSKDTVIKEFNHWLIIEALFPWDLIAKDQHMIIPKRHIPTWELNAEEKKEYEEIRYSYIEDNYEVVAEATNKKKSIPAHHHVHLIILKD